MTGDKHGHHYAWDHSDWFARADRPHVDHPFAHHDLRTDLLGHVATHLGTAGDRRVLRGVCLYPVHREGKEIA